MSRGSVRVGQEEALTQRHITAQHGINTTALGTRCSPHPSAIHSKCFWAAWFETLQGAVPSAATGGLGAAATKVAAGGRGRRNRAGDAGCNVAILVQSNLHMLPVACSHLSVWAVSASG